MIRVLLVDDHAVLRDGLRAILSSHPEFELAGEAADGLAAVKAIGQLKPDVVLLDLSLPLMSGLDVLREIARRKIEVGVVVLSVNDEPSTVRGALALGACGFLPKGAPASEVVTALRAAAARQRYLPAGLGGQTLQALLAPSPAARPVDLLSDRERQVMRLVCEGRTSAEIGALLSVSPKTVESYRARLMQKLNVGGITALVKLAIREGIIDDR